MPPRSLPFSLPLSWFRRLPVLLLLGLLFPADGNPQTNTPSISLTCSPSLIVAGETVTLTATISPSTATPNTNLTVPVTNIGYGITHTSPVIAAGDYQGTGSATNTGGARGRSISVDFAAPSGYAHGSGCSFTVAEGGGPPPPPPPPPPPTEALSFSRNAVTVEEGATAIYSVSLAEAATGSVAVTLTHSGDTDITFDPSRLTFTPSNWSTGQTVTVTAAHDDDLAHSTATIAHRASGANYNNVRGNVTVTEDDDDSGSLVFSLSSVNVPEGGNATYNLSLSHQPSSDVTVLIATKPGGDTSITVSPASRIFTSSNWSTGQTVTVEAASDPDGLNGTATIKPCGFGS